MDLNFLRNTVKLKRNALSKNEALALSLKVSNNFFSIDFIREKSTFFIYNSIKNEVDTSCIISRLTNLGKRLCYPLTVGNDMLAVEPTSNEWIVGDFGVKTPKDYSVIKDIDVAVIPLLLCDKNKNRVGYGKGYYDRFLKNKNIVKIGLAYDFQVVENLTPNEWDVPLDVIITPTRIIGELI